MEEEYAVERIEKKRVINGITQYFLKWKGYPSNQNTWEPAEHLYCTDLVAAFEKAEKRKAQAKKRASENEGKQNNKLYGFDQGVEAKILGATKTSGKLMFLMSWKNNQKPELVPAKTANVMCPIQVIKFYEERLTWATPSVAKNGKIKRSPSIADSIVKNEEANNTDTE